MFAHELILKSFLRAFAKQACFPLSFQTFKFLDVQKKHKGIFFDKHLFKTVTYFRKLFIKKFKFSGWIIPLL